jgi:hypothetical protein
MTARDAKPRATRSAPKKAAPAKAAAKPADAPVDVDRHFRSKPKPSVKVKSEPGSSRFISHAEYRGNPEAISQAVAGNLLNGLSWAHVKQDDDGYTVEGWAEKA